MLWFAACAALGIDFVIIDSYGKLSGFDIKVFLAVWLLVPLALWVIGRNIGECNRVIAYALIFGVFGGFPALVMVSISASLFFLVVKPEALTTNFLLCVAVSVAVIAMIRFVRFRRVLKGTGFVEREFKVSKSAVQIDRGVTLNGSAADKRIEHKLLPIVPSLAAGVYLLQAGLMKHAGDAALIFVVSLLMMPLALQAISQFIGGFYLWIYLTRKIERRHNLEVRFRVTEGDNEERDSRR